MSYTFDNERPIYIQLVDLIKSNIVSNRYKRGEKLPSVRDLAINLKVNPNTIQRALAELEREKLIYTERTNGKFVTEDSKLIEAAKDRIAREKVELFIKEMTDLGIERKNIVDYLEKGR